MLGAAPSDEGQAKTGRNHVNGLGINSWNNGKKISRALRRQGALSSSHDERELMPHPPPQTLPPNVKIERLQAADVPSGYRDDARRSRPSLRVTIRWYKPSCYVAMVAGVFFAVAPLLFERLSQQPSGLWTWLIFLAFALPFTYYGLILRTNRTEIVVNADELTIWNGPLPGKLVRNTRYPAELVEQVYCRKVNVGTQIKVWLFTLEIRFKSGEVLEVINKVENPDSLLYVEKQLEEYLGIADRPLGVTDEVRGNDPVVQSALEGRDV